MKDFKDSAPLFPEKQPRLITYTSPHLVEPLDKREMELSVHY